MDDRKVGVVGLGNMGGGIARNFQRAGLPLAVWDLDPAARDALAALPGVEVATLRHRFVASVAQHLADACGRPAGTCLDALLACRLQLA